MQQPPDMYYDDVGNPLPPPETPRIERFRDQLGLMDEAELAGVLGERPRTLQVRRVQGGNVPPYRRVGRRVLYLRDEVDIWLRGQASGVSPLSGVVHRVSVRRRPAG